MYTKHVDLILDRATLIYATGRPSDVHFPTHEEAFLRQKERGMRGLERRSGFSVPQKEQFINSNLPYIHEK